MQVYLFLGTEVSLGHTHTHTHTHTSHITQAHAVACILLSFFGVFPSSLCSDEYVRRVSTFPFTIYNPSGVVTLDSQGLQSGGQD